MKLNACVAIRPHRFGGRSDTHQNDDDLFDCLFYVQLIYFEGCIRSDMVLVIGCFNFDVQ